MAERASVAGSPDRDVVQALARGLAVVRAFDADHPTLTLDEAALRTGFSRSATRRLLRTLMAAGLASFEGRRFCLTAGLLDLGYAQQSALGLADVARPHAEELSRATGRTVALAQLDGADVVYVLRVGTPRFMHVELRVGSRLPAHVPAIGRVLLASLPEESLRAYLASSTWMDRSGSRGRSEVDFRAELTLIAERGWCFVSEEVDAGLQAVAVPVRDRSGAVVAALNISTATDGRRDAPALEDWVPRIQESAAAIGSDLHPRHLG